MQLAGRQEKEMKKLRGARDRGFSTGLSSALALVFSSGSERETKKLNDWSDEIMIIKKRR